MYLHYHIPLWVHSGVNPSPTIQSRFTSQLSSLCQYPNHHIPTQLTVASAPQQTTLSLPPSLSTSTNKDNDPQQVYYIQRATPTSFASQPMAEQTGQRSTVIKGAHSDQRFSLVDVALRSYFLSPGSEPQLTTPNEVHEAIRGLNVS